MYFNQFCLDDTNGYFLSDTEKRFHTFHKEMEDFTDSRVSMRMLHPKLIMIMTLAQDLLSLHQMTPV